MAVVMMSACHYLMVTMFVLLEDRCRWLVLPIAVVDFLMYGDDLMPKEKQHWLSISFIARHIGGKPKIMEPDKCSEIKWAEFATIDPESLTIPSRRCFYKYREINHPIQ